MKFLAALVALMLAQGALAEKITDPELLRRIKLVEPSVTESPEKLGPEPHTLVISDGSGMTQLEYSSGPKCQKARDEVYRQLAPPVCKSTNGIPCPPVVRRITAICVPR